MDLLLAGKRAIVTGASRGISYAVAEAHAAEGTDVVLVTRGRAARAAGAATAVWLAAYVPDLPGGHSMLDDIKTQRDAMFHPDWLGADPTSDPQLCEAREI
jgi:NAD(P)-dependent dehydrogenase (short-subunit alcohol dehydrogenase family)